MKSDLELFGVERHYKGKQYPIHRPFGTILPELEFGKPTHRTMLDARKLRVLYELALATWCLPGDIAEAGVWRGGAVYLLASTVGDKVIHAFDSWEGLPGRTEGDLMPGIKDDYIIGSGKGWGKTEPPVEYLAKFGDRVVLHKGWFADTLAAVADKQFCLVHVDCDFYQSIKECCEFFIPRMVSGGFMVFDDYGCIVGDLAGAIRGADEGLKGCGRSFEYWNWANLIVRFND